MKEERRGRIGVSEGVLNLNELHAVNEHGIGAGYF